MRLHGVSVLVKCAVVWTKGTGGVKIYEMDLESTNHNGPW